MEDSMSMASQTLFLFVQSFSSLSVVMVAVQHHGLFPILVFC